MKIIEESVTLETIQKYKDELFLFNEEMEYLQNKRIIKQYLREHIEKIINKEIDGH